LFARPDTVLLCAAFDQDNQPLATAVTTSNVGRARFDGLPASMIAAMTCEPR
jgi:hypothetical protein